MRNKINTVDVDEVNLQTIGETGTEVMIRAQAKELNEKSRWPSLTRLSKFWATIMSTAELNWSDRRLATS